MNEIVIPGVDIASGVARFAGKREMFFKMLKSFVNGLPETFDAFPDFSNPEQRAKAQAEAHTMKGTAGNMSVVDLYQAAMKYEHTIKEGTTTLDDYLTYQAAVKLAKSTIAPILAATSAPTVSSNTGTKDELNVILRELLGALELYQASTCDKCADKIKAKTWSGVDRAVLDAICADINSFDYELATEKINAIL